MVIDAGSSFVRAGFGGEDKCKACFPNMVGRPRFSKVRAVRGRGRDNRPLATGERRFQRAHNFEITMNRL